MADRKKVIAALSECNPFNQCYEERCPYYKDNNCLESLHEDVLKLLKKQKHKTGYWENGHCTCCGEDIASKLDTWTNVRTFSFCPKCGAEMEVKWDE